MKEVMKHFEEFFEIVPSNSPQLINECKALRYQVFCNEKGFFQNNTNSLEQDEFDERSVHCLLKHKPSGEYAATVRLVLPDYDNPAFSYPLEQKMLAIDNKDIEFLQHIPRNRLAEISRFSVSKKFRRRVSEENLVHGINNRFADEVHFKGRRVDAYITLGLFKAIVRMSATHEINYWCAFMERSLIRLLQRVGIEFKPVGSAINYYGERLCCYEDAHQVLEGIKHTKPEVWEFITDDGEYALEHE